MPFRLLCTKLYPDTERPNELGHLGQAYRPTQVQTAGSCTAQLYVWWMGKMPARKCHTNNLSSISPSPQKGQNDVWRICVTELREQPCRDSAECKECSDIAVSGQMLAAKTASSSANSDAAQQGVGSERVYIDIIVHHASPLKVPGQVHGRPVSRHFALGLETSATTSATTSDISQPCCASPS